MGATESGRRHTRDDVASAALRILDDYGLPDLTMRRLAAALDVQPSALYWHFPNKQSLLAELADRIVAQSARLHRGTDAGSHTRSEAEALRGALLAYRDGAEVVSSTLALGLGSPTARDRLSAAITADGFDTAIAERAASTLLHFILGQVSHEQQRMQYESVGVVAPSVDPSTTGGDDAASDYAFGVDLFIDGLKNRRSREARIMPTRTRTACPD